MLLTIAYDNNYLQYIIPLLQKIIVFCFKTRQNERKTAAKKKLFSLRTLQRCTLIMKRKLNSHPIRRPPTTQQSPTTVQQVPTSNKRKFRVGSGIQLPIVVVVDVVCVCYLWSCLVFLVCWEIRKFTIYSVARKEIRDYPLPRQSAPKTTLRPTSKTFLIGMLPFSRLVRELTEYYSDAISAMVWFSEDNNSHFFISYVLLATSNWINCCAADGTC